MQFEFKDEVINNAELIDNLEELCKTSQKFTPSQVNFSF